MTAVDLPFQITRRRQLAPSRRIPFTQRLDQPLALVVWMTIHIAVAEAARISDTASRVHFLIATIACLVASMRATTLADALVPVFYILPVDVFWRMTGTISPWEGGKYITTILAAIAIVRFVGRPQRAGLPLMYLCLLIPAAYPTLYTRGLGDGRGQLAFYLAGPIAFVTLAVLFGQITMRWSQLERYLWVLLGPMVGATWVATRSASELQVVDFSANSSNAAASGGFGPNQVAAMLSLGALVCLLIVLRERRIHFRLIAGGIALWMVGQSALTFSRGGVVNLVAAAIIVVPALLVHRLIGPRLVVTLGLGALVVALVVLPGLDAFTGGSIEERFADRSLTGREELADIDLRLFEQTLPFGVGVAGADRFHSIGPHDNVSSHNEFTRLLAEHGLLGVTALLVLGAMIVSAFVRQPGNLGRAWSGGLAFWGLAELSHSSTRIAIGMGAIALAMMRVVDDGIDPEAEDSPADPTAASPAQPRASRS